MVCMYILPRYFNYTYTVQNAGFTSALLDLSRHLHNWWDWYRTGWYHQGSRKKWGIKKTIKQAAAFWLRILPSKSGWLGKALARRKKGA